MLKGGILNGQLLRVLGETGHKDLLLVSDAGMPLPKDVERVDLSLVPGIPAYTDVLQAVVDDIMVEKAFLAEEVKTISPKMHAKILEILKPTGCEIEYVPHVELKQIMQTTRACIRSGEFTGYANVILQAGVSYGGDAER
ncbi:D-ribose pyranase [Christensenellaceae bacterium NSJ-63]|uniref:D-ribose pyranase n=1 Tax=Guopingia tenuis TaxID=2763656 RepID=A0A926DJL8_9FIRM|nr:D-ribose pyranase [Guopingia tenuis]MBC8538305.1 D-ribose pyranase [Guopingia tenuis]